VTYEQLSTLGEVVRRPELVLVEVIAQDEFTHDVVLQGPAGFVVFDAT
jgi:hypothetical protein